MHHTQPHLPQPRKPQPRKLQSISMIGPHFAVPAAARPAPAPPGGRSVELAHDARNLVSALYLYSELIASPGVLAPGFGGYAEDLRRLADSGAGLIAALAAKHGELSSGGKGGRLQEIDDLPLARRRFPGIEDLASELDALRGPLQALAGPGVRLEVESMPCAGRLALNAEDLLRILFNLVANAVEALASLPPELRRRPLLRITAQRGGAASFLERGSLPRPGSNEDRLDHQPEGQTVLLSVRDNGPGIDARHLPHIFAAGFSTRRNVKNEDDTPRARGLGLAIVRRLVAAAGGAIRAVSPSGLGARFDIELPILRPEAEPGADARFEAESLGSNSLHPGKKKDSQLETNLSTNRERGVGCLQLHP